MMVQLLRSNPRQALKKANWLARIPVTVLMPAASVLLAVDLIVDANPTNLLVFSGSLAGAAAAIWPREVSKLCEGFFRWQQRHKINLLPVACCVLTALWWLDFTSAPAHAQFFIQTENWLRSSFPLDSGGAGGTDIYALVFNTLRAIFVLYLAVALVRVIAAARNDEDWQSLARTPLIILITVTLGDILAGLITGGGTGGGTPAGG